MTTRYTKDHEWARLEGDVVVCGVSTYAVEQLGDVVYVELPDVGRAVKRGDSMAVVESAKTASDVYAPVSGEVVAVNDALANAPQTVNEGPEGAGWFVRLQPTDPTELETLMDEGAYQALLKTL